MSLNNAKWQSFKQDINLIDFACSYGYVINKKKSTKQSVCLSKANEDKIIVSRKNGVWVYFSVYDTNDSGTIVDFVKHKLQKSYTDTFALLENWKGELTEMNTNYYVNESSSYEQKRVKQVFSGCKTIDSHPYLAKRGIYSEILRSHRFKDTIMVDRFGNIVFPQFKDNTISALELKNDKLHVFVKGSIKTLWQSNRFKSDTQLIVAETVIDALSYQSLFSLSDAFYIATSGSPSKNQLNLIALISRDFKQIMCIADNDTGGDMMYERLKAVVEHSETNCFVDRYSPQIRGEDWNDVLMNTIA